MNTTRSTKASLLSQDSAIRSPLSTAYYWENASKLTSAGSYTVDNGKDDWESLIDYDGHPSAAVSPLIIQKTQQLGRDLPSPLSLSPTRSVKKLTSFSASLGDGRLNSGGATRVYSDSSETPYMPHIDNFTFTAGGNTEVSVGPRLTSLRPKNHASIISEIQCEVNGAAKVKCIPRLEKETGQKQRNAQQCLSNEARSKILSVDTTCLDGKMSEDRQSQSLRLEDQDNIGSGKVFQDHMNKTGELPQHFQPSSNPSIPSLNPSTRVLTSTSPSARDLCRKLSGGNREDPKSTTQSTNWSSFSTGSNSIFQNDLDELLQMVTRAADMICASRDSLGREVTPTALYLDLKSAHTKVVNFLKRSLALEDPRSEGDNLTALPTRKPQSYYEQYCEKKRSACPKGAQLIDGTTSQAASKDAKFFQDQLLSSLSLERLESVVLDLEKLIQETLEIADSRPGQYDPKIYDELQDIASSFRQENRTTVNSYQSHAMSAEYQALDPSDLNSAEARPAAKMNRLPKQEPKIEEEIRTRTGEYHKALAKLHESPNPPIQSSRNETKQGTGVQKDAAVPEFLANSRTNSNEIILDLDSLPLRGPTDFKQDKQNNSHSQPRRRKSIPLCMNCCGRDSDERSSSVGSVKLYRVRSEFQFPSEPLEKPEGPNENSLKELHGVSSQDWATSPSPSTQQFPHTLSQEGLPQIRPAPSVTGTYNNPNPSEKRPLPVKSILKEPPTVTHGYANGMPLRAPRPTEKSESQKARNGGNRPTRKELKQYMKNHSQPPVYARKSSVGQADIRHRSVRPKDLEANTATLLAPDTPDTDDYIVDFVGAYPREPINVDGASNNYSSFPEQPISAPSQLPTKEGGHIKETGIPLQDNPQHTKERPTKISDSDLHKSRHVSFYGRHGGFSIHRSHKRAPIARDWTNRRKRVVATIACISTALLGTMIGIYAGETPALQYVLVDEHHQFIYLGNVLLFAGLAISNILFWPLPVLHGRKPYTLSGLVVLLPLLFPQAMAVMEQRQKFNKLARVGLLLPRFLGGLALGFANMNFFGALLDVFGASLMSSNPHQEITNPYDARRHGGGMGVWLSIWTWCYIGSIGVGFLIGTVITSNLNLTWGFWICIFITMGAILLNIVAPETRRSPYRRSMTEVQTGSDVSRRVARGEVMMHLYSTGPEHWWQEMFAGWILCIRMLRQLGFLVIAAYQAWVYGQVIMVMILLGALTSKYYHLHPWQVGLCVAAFPFGALLAVPFQKASVFSRARHHPQRTDSMTFQTRVIWTSHMARRTLFMSLLPLAGICYTLFSRGKSTPLVLPVLFAALIGLLSNLALSECQGLMMENYDTSDLQPGMTGRPRKLEHLPEKDRSRRTNFSCFPRVTASFAIVQSLSFAIAAAATACGGNVERTLGAQTSTAIVAGVLAVLTLALFAALLRFKTVQVVPTVRVPSVVLAGPGEDLPIVIGNPSGTMRRTNLLELGAMTRWTEIRRRNRLL